MPSLWYVAAAYGVIWIVLFIYLIPIHQRVATIRQQLELSRRRLETPAREAAVKTAAPEHVGP